MWQPAMLCCADRVQVVSWARQEFFKEVAAEKQDEHISIAKVGI